MTSSRRYNYNRKPRMSAAQMATYLCATNPVQRTSVIREARFPRIIQTSAYTRARPTMMKVLQGGKTAFPAARLAITRLEADARSVDGIEKMELNRCAAAIEDFLDLYTTAKLSRFTFKKGGDFNLQKHGLTINVSTNGIVEHEVSGATYSGACIIFTASSDGARENIDRRLKMMSGLVLWALEDSGQMEPLARLCFAIDVHGGEVVRASPSFDRFRAHVEGAAQEIFDGWNRVKPPKGYDGPDPD
jgi:hypothetical protein